MPDDAKRCKACGTKTAEEPGCLMFLVGPLLLVVGLTTLFGLAGTLVGLTLVVIALALYAIGKGRNP